MKYQSTHYGDLLPEVLDLVATHEERRAALKSLPADQRSHCYLDKLVETVMTMTGNPSLDDVIAARLAGRTWRFRMLKRAEKYLREVCREPALQYEIKKIRTLRRVMARLAGKEPFSRFVARHIAAQERKVMHETRAQGNGHFVNQAYKRMFAQGGRAVDHLDAESKLARNAPRAVIFAAARMKGTGKGLIGLGGYLEKQVPATQQRSSEERTECLYRLRTVRSMDPRLYPCRNHTTVLMEALLILVSKAASAWEDAVHIYLDTDQAYSQELFQMLTGQAPIKQNLRPYLPHWHALCEEITVVLHPAAMYHPLPSPNAVDKNRDKVKMQAHAIKLAEHTLLLAGEKANKRKARACPVTFIPLVPGVPAMAHLYSVHECRHAGRSDSVHFLDAQTRICSCEDSRKNPDVRCWHIFAAKNCDLIQCDLAARSSSAPQLHRA